MTNCISTSSSDQSVPAPLHRATCAQGSFRIRDSPRPWRSATHCAQRRCAVTVLLARPCEQRLLVAQAQFAQPRSLLSGSFLQPRAAGWARRAGRIPKTAVAQAACRCGANLPAMGAQQRDSNETPRHRRRQRSGTPQRQGGPPSGAGAARADRARLQAEAPANPRRPAQPDPACAQMAASMRSG